MIKHLQDMLASATDDTIRENYANALKHAQDHQAELTKQRPQAEKEAADAAAKQGQGQPPQ